MLLNIFLFIPYARFPSFNVFTTTHLLPSFAVFGIWTDLVAALWCKHCFKFKSYICTWS